MAFKTTFPTLCNRKEQKIIDTPVSNITQNITDKVVNKEIKDGEEFKIIDFHSNTCKGTTTNFVCDVMASFIPPMTHFARLPK